MRSLDSLMEREPASLRADLDAHNAALEGVLAGSRRAVLYPAARLAREAAPKLLARGVEIVAFGDRNPELQGSVMDGLPVLSPAAVARDHADDVVLIASTLFDTPIRTDLEARGCRHIVPIAYLAMRLPDVFPARELAGAFDQATDPANRDLIESAYGLFGDAASQQTFVGKLDYYLTQRKESLERVRSTQPIYFDPDVFHLRVDEIVVDGGAYNGDTLQAFVTASGGHYRTYVAFEPDPANLRTLRARAASDRRICVEGSGLGRAKGQGRLLSLQGFDSRLADEDDGGGVAVPIVALDEYFSGRDVPTIIKMDIEGAEADALEGARRLLASHPILLAISVYHRPSDLWELPLLMARLAPKTRLFLRHYTREFDDTVCYAVPAQRL